MRGPKGIHSGIYRPCGIDPRWKGDGEARLTWVFITGGSRYGKADVEGVDGVDDDMGLACQGGVAGSTASLCTHDRSPRTKVLEGSDK